MRDLDAVWENRLLSRWGAAFPRPPGQRGGVHETDSELIALGDGRLLAVNVDAVAEEVRAGLYDPYLAGRTAVVSALSDLSACGAEALGVLLAVTLPDEGMQAGVARGARDACDAAGTFVLGGDTNEGPDLAVACVAVGIVPEAVARTRVGALPGDALWAAGPLGAGSALAAHRLLGTPAALFGPDDYRPQPRLREGLALRGIASAAMDTSDGLVATLDQLARLNDARFVVDDAAAVLHPRVDALRRALALPALAFLAGHHGEFELVFTVPPSRADAFRAAADAIGWRPVRLGHVDAGSGVVLGGVDVDGARLRNLLHEVGDPRAYVTALLALIGGGS